MPPLALTQSKYALAPPVMSVKSVPGCLVTIAPILTGAPLAGLLLPRPHLEAVELDEPPPLLVSLLFADPLEPPEPEPLSFLALPQALRLSTRAAPMAQSAMAGRLRPLKGLTSIAPPRPGCSCRWPERTSARSRTSVPDTASAPWS